MHPAGLPDLFLDRSLGRVQVPNILRAADLRLHTLAEVYGIPADEDVSDEDWLARAGDEGWAVLMKDERIRYREAEQAAVIGHGVRAFCLSRGNLRSAEMAGLYLSALDSIIEACSRPGPMIYVLSGEGLRRTQLD